METGWPDAYFRCEGRLYSRLRIWRLRAVVRKRSTASPCPQAIRFAQAAAAATRQGGCKAMQAVSPRCP